MQSRVLIIAGSDPSGGAGVQADIKTVTALGAYAASAITALTVQNTKGVTAVHAVAPEIIAAQIDAVMSDIGADAIKIGMIGDAETADLLAEILPAYARAIPIVLDPVLASTSGDALAGEGVARILLEKLAPLARIITPNAPEAAALTGIAVDSEAAMRRAGKALLQRGPGAVLVKGGHMAGAEVVDILFDANGEQAFRHSRIETRSTHGTGCTLASAIATGLAQDMPLAGAVARATNYVHEAIRTAPGFGGGCGPLNHTANISD